MSNFVYSMVSEALARVVSERAADHMLRAALRDAGVTPEDVTPEEMQRVLAGPLQQRLNAVMPPARARAELSRVADRLQSSYPKAPTLFPESSGADSARTWNDDVLRAAPEPEAVASPASDDDDFELDLDDFLLDDPEEASGAEAAAQDSGKAYALGSTAGQDELLSDFARFDGVAGVVICDAQGKVVRSRVPRGNDTLARLVARVPELTAARPARLVCADFSAHTVYVKTLQTHTVGILANGNASLGRIIVELSALKETA